MERRENHELVSRGGESHGTEDEDSMKLESGDEETHVCILRKKELMKQREWREIRT